MLTHLLRAGMVQCYLLNVSAQDSRDSEVTTSFDGGLDPRPHAWVGGMVATLRRVGRPVENSAAGLPLASLGSLRTGSRGWQVQQVFRCQARRAPCCGPRPSSRRWFAFIVTEGSWAEAITVVALLTSGRIAFETSR